MFLSHRAVLDCGCLLVSLVLAGSLAGQVATNPELTNPPTLTAPATSTASPPPANAEGQPVAPEVRRLHYELKLDLRGVYDDNIGLSQQNRLSDYYFRIDPSIAIGFGSAETREANFFRLEYDPDIVFFVDHTGFNTFQHVAHLVAGSSLSRLTLGLTEDAQFLKGSDVNQALGTGSFVNAVNLDVRGRPQVNTFNTQATASYELAGKTSLSLGVQSMITDYSQFISSQRISGSLFVNYAYSPKLTFGIGGTGGRELVDQPSPDQTFEQANVRASYELTGKLTANGSAGVEFRQFDVGRGIYVSPVFEINLTYTPFDGSIFILSGSRHTTSSGSLAGQDFTSTQFVASWRQRFLQRFFVSLTGGFENLSYLETIANINSTRQDNYYFVQPALDVQIMRFWYVGGYYLHRQDDSSVSIFAFDENQAGLRATFTF